MLSRRQRLRRAGRTCRDLKRECDMQVEHAMLHHSPGGKIFEVQRLACTYCDRQVTTARKQTDPGDAEANF